MYEAQIIYSYCVENSHRGLAEDKSATPFSGKKIPEQEDGPFHRTNVDGTYGMFLVTLLKDLFEKTGTIFDYC
jgi:hypothetical protein